VLIRDLPMTSTSKGSTVTPSVSNISRLRGSGPLPVPEAFIVMRKPATCVRSSRFYCNDAKIANAQFHLRTPGPVSPDKTFHRRKPGDYR
jgi:hypothetical protein